jgi:hypothetical protein
MKDTEENPFVTLSRSSQNWSRIVTNLHTADKEILAARSHLSQLDEKRSGLLKELQAEESKMTQIAKELAK